MTMDQARIHAICPLLTDINNAIQPGHVNQFHVLLQPYMSYGIGAPISKEVILASGFRHREIVQDRDVAIFHVRIISLKSEAKIIRLPWRVISSGCRRMTKVPDRHGSCKNMSNYYPRTAEMG